MVRTVPALINRATQFEKVWVEHCNDEYSKKFVCDVGQCYTENLNEFLNKTLYLVNLKSKIVYFN